MTLHHFKLSIVLIAGLAAVESKMKRCSLRLVTVILCVIVLAGCSPKPASTRQQVIDALGKMYGRDSAEEKYQNWMAVVARSYPDIDMAHLKILDYLQQMEKNPPRRSLADFRTLTTNMTIDQIVERVGICDRVRGSGILYYEYDFPEGSAVLVCPDLSAAARTNPTTSIEFVASTNEITLYP